MHSTQLNTVLTISPLFSVLAGFEQKAESSPQAFLSNAIFLCEFYTRYLLQGKPVNPLRVPVWKYLEYMLESRKPFFLSHCFRLVSILFNFHFMLKKCIFFIFVRPVIMCVPKPASCHQQLADYCESVLALVLMSYHEYHTSELQETAQATLKSWLQFFFRLFPQTLFIHFLYMPLHVCPGCQTVLNVNVFVVFWSLNIVCARQKQRCSSKGPLNYSKLENLV